MGNLFENTPAIHKAVSKENTETVHASLHCLCTIKDLFSNGHQYIKRKELEQPVHTSATRLSGYRAMKQYHYLTHLPQHASHVY